MSKNQQPQKEAEKPIVQEEDKGTKPVEQILHKINVKLKKVKLNLDEAKVTKKILFKPNLQPFDAEFEEKDKRKERIVEKKIDFLTYATIYFGSKIHSKQEQKLLIKKQIQDKIDKELKKKQQEDWAKARLANYNQIKKSEQEKKSRLIEESKGTIQDLNSTGKAEDPNQKKPVQEKKPVQVSNVPNQNKQNEPSKEKEGQKEEKKEDDPLNLNLNNQSLLEIGVMNPKNMTKVQNSKIKPGLTPDFSDKDFTFIRGTETFFTIAIWQRDSEQQQYYKQRLQFLQDRYQGDNLIGECRVDFSTFFKKQKKQTEEKKPEGEKKPEVQKKEEEKPPTKLTDTFQIKMDGEVIGEIEVDVNYEAPKIPDKRLVQDQLGLIIKQVEVQQKMSKKEAGKFVGGAPYILFHLGSVRKKTSVKTVWGDSMIFKEDIVYKRVAPEASKIYFEVINVDGKSDLQRSGGLASMDLDKMEELDVLQRQMLKKSFEVLEKSEKEAIQKRVEKLKKKLGELSISYKGVQIGTMKVVYEVVPRKEPKQFKLKTEFKDMKDLLGPDKFQKQREKHLEKRQKLFAQKFSTEFQPHKEIQNFEPSPNSLAFDRQKRSFFHKEGISSVLVRQTDKKYLENTKKKLSPDKLNNSAVLGIVPDRKKEIDPKFLKTVKTFANVKEVIKIQLPNITTLKREINTENQTLKKENHPENNAVPKTSKAITPNIYVKVLKDSKYNHAIYGHGLSTQHSTSTLRYSVPEYSQSKAPRFLNADNGVPAPFEYQTQGGGIFQQQLEIDQKLKIRRQKLLEYEQKRKLRLKSPKK